MECQEIRDLLSPYVDDALEPALADRVKTHLEHCPACREELLELEAYLEAMSRLPRYEAPPGLVEAVRARIDDEGFWKRWGNRLFRPVRFKIPLELAGVLATAAVIVISYQALQERETGPVPGSPAGRVPMTIEEHALKTAPPPPPREVTPSMNRGPLLVLRPMITGPPEDRIPAARTTDEEWATPAPQSRERLQTGDSLTVREKAPEAASGAAGLSSEDRLPETPTHYRGRERLSEAPGVGPAKRAGSAVLRNVTAAIEAAGGTVIDIHPSTHAGGAERILFDLPAGRYEELIRRLKNHGRVEAEEEEASLSEMVAPRRFELLVHS